MTCKIETKSYNPHSVRKATMAGLSIVILTAMFAAPVYAEDRRDDHNDNRQEGDRRGEEHHDNRRGNRGYDGGYYRAPAVVYGSPGYYRAPPVIYGPNFGVTLGIR